MYFFADRSCVELQIEMDSKPGSVIPQEHLDTAIKLGIQEIDAVDVTKYVVAFLRNFLLQREKIDNKLLANYLNRETIKLWQEVLSSLEDTNRKLVSIQSGSVVFTLFCPTRESRLQLEDETWRIEIQKKMAELLKVLGTFLFVHMKE